MKIGLIWCIVIFTFLFDDSKFFFVSSESLLGDKKTILKFDIGENIMTENADDEMSPVSGIVYFVGRKYEQIWWSTNGFVEISNSKPKSLSFRCSVSNISHPVYSGKHLIAPSCDDLKTKVSSVGERIFYRSSSNKYDIIHPTDFTSISNFIQDHYISPLISSLSSSLSSEQYEYFSKLEITWFFVITFDQVSLIHSERQTQSFQLIIATDELRKLSFAIFQYPSDGLTGGESYQHPNLVGILDGSSDQHILIRNHIKLNNFEREAQYFYPNSINHGSNIAIPGTYIFRLDGERLSFKEPLTCNEEYDFLSCNHPFGFCNTTSMSCVCEGKFYYSSEQAEVGRRREIEDLLDVDYNFFGKRCSECFYCFGVSSLDKDHVCGGYGGSCVGYDNCSCPDGVDGRECQVFQCFGKDREDEGVCSSLGRCLSKDNCNCSQVNIGGSVCNQSACYGKCRSLSSVPIPPKSSSTTPTDLLQIVDNFEDSSSFSSFWNFPESEGFVRKFRGGCGGEFGHFLFFTGNNSRRLTSHTLQPGKITHLSFWFTQGRTVLEHIKDPSSSSSSSSSSSELISSQDILYPYCHYSLPESSPFISFSFDVFVRIVSVEDEEEVFFEEKLGKNLGVPYMYSILKKFHDPISIPKRSFLVISQTLPSDLEWDGRGGEWGLDSVILTVLPMEEMPCSGRGECTETGKCVCDKEISVGRECEFSVCFGIPSNDPSVCSGRGRCVGENLCLCDDQNTNDLVGPGKGDCSGTSCYHISSTSSLVCSGHGKCYVNEYPLRNNFCCCEYGFYGYECESFDYKDFVFEPQCFRSTGDHKTWSKVYSGEFTSGNLKCGSISGQSLYFSSTKSSSSSTRVSSYSSKKQRRIANDDVRSLISDWLPLTSKSLELSFWLIQGRGTSGCTYSGLPTYLEVVIEADLKVVFDGEEDEDSQDEWGIIETSIIKEIDFSSGSMFREWSFVEIPFEVPENSTSFRLIIRQKMFALDSDQWSIDLIRMDLKDYPELGFRNWWIFILLGLFAFSIVVVIMVISVVVIYAVYHRMKLVVRVYVEKKANEWYFYELYEEEEQNELKEEQNNELKKDDPDDDHKDISREWNVEECSTTDEEEEKEEEENS